MVNHPLVSICIPTYNRAGMVGKAIDSALSQSYRNIEVLVVDNASDDDIESVISGYNDPRLHFFKNSKNLGIFGNFNRCIELSHGDYIHILHSDDYIDPNFTETCVQFFESHPDVSLTYTSAHFICGNDSQDVTNFSENTIFKAPDGFRQILMQRISIVCPSVMVRRKIYNEIGFFSLDYPYAADYYEWLKISRQYNIAYVKDAWINYCIGEHSETYSYLFKNPRGYLDIINIYVRITLELDRERDAFTQELNAGCYQFIKNLLSAGFTRSEQMSYMSPSFFYGIAISTHALVKPNTLKEKIKKLGYSILIHFAGFCMSFSLLRDIAKLYLMHRKYGY